MAEDILNSEQQLSNVEQQPQEIIQPIESPESGITSCNC